MATEPITPTSSDRRAVDPLNPINLELNQLLSDMSAPGGVANWSERLDAIRQYAATHGPWDDTCAETSQKITSTATNQALDGLKTELATGRVGDWDLRLQDIRAQASNVWSAADQSKAEEIGLIGMSQDMREIGASKDALSRQTNIDVAQRHNRTFRSFGVDVFSDDLREMKTQNQFALAAYYDVEAVDHRNQAGLAVLDGDLSSAWSNVKDNQRSLSDSRTSFLRGVTRMFGFGSNE